MSTSNAGLLAPVIHHAVAGWSDVPARVINGQIPTAGSSAIYIRPLNGPRYDQEGANRYGERWISGALIVGYLRWSGPFITDPEARFLGFRGQIRRGHMPPGAEWMTVYIEPARKPAIREGDLIRELVFARAVDYSNQQRKEAA